MFGLKAIIQAFPGGAEGRGEGLDKTTINLSKYLDFFHPLVRNKTDSYNLSKDARSRIRQSNPVPPVQKQNRDIP
jgi:hypothetical protein